jgi:hypothetical protein
MVGFFFASPIKNSVKNRRPTACGLSRIETKSNRFSFRVPKSSSLPPLWERKTELTAVNLPNYPDFGPRDLQERETPPIYSYGYLLKGSCGKRVLIG